MADRDIVGTYVVRAPVEIVKTMSFVTRLSDL